MAATAFPLTPAFAQEAPPVTSTVAAPPAATPAPAPAAQAPVFAPSAPVVQATPPRPEIEAAVAAATAERPRSATPRAAAPRAAAPRIAAPRATAPAPAPAPIQAGETITEARSVPENIIPVPAADPVTPAPVAEPTAIDAEPATSGDPTPWGLIIGGLLIAGAIAAFLLSRRRRGEREVYHAPTDAEGVPVAEVNLNERPWIRLALQPKPAEAANDQKVEYELTVENEGRVAARDVRVSSFMLAGADSNAGENALIDDDRNTRHIDVQPGETVRLAGSFDIRDFLDPKLIADARYALPDGGEGHLAAKFGIDLSTPERPAHVEDVLERV